MRASGHCCNIKACRCADLRAERSPEGVVEIMPPAGLESSYGSRKAFGQLRDWAKKDGRRVVFDSRGWSIRGAGLSPYIVRGGAAVELADPKALEADAPVKGFVLDLGAVWNL